MKRIRVLLFVTLALLCAPALAAEEEAEVENCIKNGDFDKGKVRWRTAPGMRVVEMEEAEKEGKNRVLEVRLDKRKARAFSQRISIKKKTQLLDISFRIKASDDFEPAIAAGDQFSVRCERPDRSTTYTSRKLEKKGEWEKVEWQFSRFEGARQITFSIEINAGEGKVWIDDICVKQLEP